jgi:hypothetical protein
MLDATNATCESQLSEEAVQLALRISDSSTIERNGSEFSIPV